MDTKAREKIKKLFEGIPPFTDEELRTIRCSVLLCGAKATWINRTFYYSINSSRPRYACDTCYERNQQYISQEGAWKKFNQDEH